jgi:2-hydroxychromene-2-carboxylate isomerase
MEKGFSQTKQTVFWLSLRPFGIDNAEAAMSDTEVKNTLRANTETAIKAGVFGVPTFLIDDQVFWGADATEMMLSYANNPELFQTPEMRRISEMPMGVVRRK